MLINYNFNYINELISLIYIKLLNLMYSNACHDLVDEIEFLVIILERKLNINPRIDDMSVTNHGDDLLVCVRMGTVCSGQTHKDDVDNLGAPFVLCWILGHFTQPNLLSFFLFFFY